MPDLDLTIGGRLFNVTCQPGQEDHLRRAARLLDEQAAPLASSGMRLSEARLMLLAGLMLSDRTIELEERLAATEARLAEIEARPAPEPVRIEVPVETMVEVPVIPRRLIERVAQLAAEAEAIAAAAEERATALADAEGEEDILAAAEALRA